MQRFSTLFGEKFDYEELVNGKEPIPPPVDTLDNLRLLSNIESSEDVHLVHVRLGEELSGRPFYERNIGGLELRKKGNDLYKAGKFEEALSVYNEAIRLNSFEVRHFSNAALCLLALGRNEEAITICSIASDVDPKFPKIHLLMVKASCNLGFVEPALTYAQDMIESVPHNELSAYLDELKAVIRSVLVEREKAMDDQELEITKKRLLSSDQGPPEVYAFLLQHLLELSAKSTKEMAEKNFPILLECMTKTPYISTFIANPALELTQLTAGSCRVVGSYLIQLKYHCEDDRADTEKLLHHPIFAPFFSELAFSLVKRSTIQANFTAFGPGYLFNCLFSAFLYFLATFAESPTIRNGFLKETPPFNDLPFYIYLMALDPCIFDTKDSPDTNMIVEAFTAVSLEPWFIAKMEESLPMGSFDHTVSIMATISTIFLQCRSVHFRLSKPPFASFLPLWRKLSKHPKFCQIMASRPGVWHHFAVRLDYATKDLDGFLEHAHHRAHLEEALEVVKTLSQQPSLNSAIFENDDISNRLQSSFVAVLKFAGRRFKGQMASFADSLAKTALQTVGSLFENSLKFAEKLLISNEESIVQTVAFLVYGKTRSSDVSSAGVGCLRVLVKTATPTQLCELSNTPNFPSFVGKIVETLVETDKEPAEIHSLSMDILCLLAESSPKNGRFFKVLATSNPYGFVKAVAHFIQKGSLSSNAGLLLAKVLPSSVVFADACSSLGDELSRGVIVAVQAKLDSCKSETDREMLEELVSVLKV